jgi:hypothetical protein
MHPYISLKWDPEKIGHQALMVDGAATPEERVTGVGYEYRLPDPVSRSDIEYYRDKANNGYLAHTVREGESPSLYFETESERDARIEEKRRMRAMRAQAEGEGLGGEGNRLW